jgi:hypothetical protein
MGFAISKGLERNKVILHFLRRFAAAGGSCNSGQWIVTTSNWPDSARAKLPGLFSSNLFFESFLQIPKLFLQNS